MAEHPGNVRPRPEYLSIIMPVHNEGDTLKEVLEPLGSVRLLGA